MNGIIVGMECGNPSRIRKTYGIFERPFLSKKRIQYEISVTSVRIQYNLCTDSRKCRLDHKQLS